MAEILLGPLKLTLVLAVGTVGLLIAAWSVDWILVSAVWPDRIDGLRALPPASE